MAPSGYRMRHWVAPLVAAIVFTGSYCFGSEAMERFKTEPSDEVAAKGQIVELKCIVENRVGEVQWLRDGFGLGHGPTFDGYPRYRVNEDPARGFYNLVITNVQLEDDAIFQCQVGATETSPGLMSRVATLTVNVPPTSVSIEGAPVVDVILGLDSELVCRTIRSRPAASMSWTRNGAAVATVAATMVTPGEGKLIDAASRLTIRPTMEDHGATYSCQAEHSAALQKFNAQVQLNVLYSPIVAIKMMPNENIREFDRVEFSCTANANPPVDEWQWLKDDDVISGEDKATLVLERVDRSFNGKAIACQAKNKVAATKVSTVINMKYGPQFVTDVTELTADNGAAEVTMSCEADSNPGARYTWSRDIARHQVLSRGPILTVDHVTAESFGVYVCAASVDGYQTIQRAVRLLMNGPAIVTSARSQTARFGDDVIVECQVRAIPRPTYVTWIRDGFPLNVNKHDRYTVEEKDIPYGRISLLRISSVQDSDFGVFNCSADNGYGVINVEITLSQSAIVPLHYILGASLTGLLLVIIICIIIFVCRRRRLAGSEIGSDSSECRMTRGDKKDCLASHESKMNYSSKGSDNGELADSFPGDNYIDAWKATGRYDGRHQRGTPLARDHYYYPCDSWSRHSASYPLSPSIHSELLVRPPSSGIYDVSDSRRPGSIDDFRVDNVYWPDVYGTTRPRGLPPHRDVTTPYDFRPIRTTSPSPLAVEFSQLATNV